MTEPSSHHSTGTRDGNSMRAYAAKAHAAQLRAVLSQAERESDRELAMIIRAELKRRGV